MIYQRYRDLIAEPGAKSLIFLSILTRLVNIPLGALLTIVGFEISGSWLWGGVTGGLVAGASAFIMWIGGRAMDVWSPRIVLFCFLPSSLLPLLYLTDLHLLDLLLVSFLVGLGRPPTGTTMRTSWQRLLPEGEKRSAAYAIDATITPLAGALGAALGGVLYAWAGFIALILFIAILSFASTLGLALNKTTQKKGARKSMKGKDTLPLGSASWLTIIIVACSWTALVGVELLAGKRLGPEALAAATAFGMLGVALGASEVIRSRDTLGKNSLLRGSLLAATSLPLFLLGVYYSSPLALIAVIALGVGRGMISSGGSNYLSIVSPEERRSEALGLYGSGVLLGQALYRPLAGLLVLSLPFLAPVLPAAALLLLAKKIKQIN